MHTGAVMHARGAAAEWRRVVAHGAHLLRALLHAVGLLPTLRPDHATSLAPHQRTLQLGKHALTHTSALALALSLSHSLSPCSLTMSGGLCV